MTDTPTDDPPVTDPPLLIEPAPDRTPGDVIRALGFDPDQIRSLVVTPSSVVAVAVDYPDPHVEVSDGNG